MDLSNLTDADVRNPVYNATGGIDCEINHPKLGWIPFTAVDDDVMPHGRVIHQHCLNAKPAKYVPSPGTIEQVKAEANRRITALCPEWKQRNLLAQAAILNQKPQNTWTAAEAAAWADGEQVWNAIQLIRTKSNEIEAMNPIPSDVSDDGLWG